MLTDEDVTLHNKVAFLSRPESYPRKPAEVMLRAAPATEHAVLFSHARSLKATIGADLLA